MRIAFASLILMLAAAGGAVAQLETATVPDLIFYDGKIVTVDPSFSVQQAMAVRGDEILAIGADAPVRALAGPATRQIDLTGHTVIPGMMDNHIHVWNAAWLLNRGVDMTGVHSKQDVLDRLSAAVAKAKPGEPIITNIGWGQGAQVPSRAELDQVSGDHIVILMRARGSAFLNSAALKAAGITRDTELLEGNPVAKDASGEPTGQIGPPGTVNTVIPELVPWPPVKDQEEWLAKLQDELLAQGFTGIREIELKPEGMRAYQALRRDGRLKLRVSMGLDVNAVDWDKLPQILAAWGPQPGFGDHWLRIDSISEFALDSTINTALFRQPKLRPAGSLGSMRITPEQLTQAMITINRYGWRPAPHITGDGTLEATLDAYEAANKISPIKDRRWVVEHIPYVEPDQMDRMAKLGVLVSAQIQAYGGTEGAARVLGPERANRMVPVRELLDHKLVVSTGSDWSGAAKLPSDFLNIQFYVTRKAEDGDDAGPQEKISREEALRMCTINNAYMTYEEDAKGSLEPGKLADFEILSDDLMTVPEDKIKDVHPLAVYVGGKEAYADPNGGF